MSLTPMPDSFGTNPFMQIAHVAIVLAMLRMLMKPTPSAYYGLMECTLLPEETTGNAKTAMG